MKKLLVVLCLIAPSVYAADCSKTKTSNENLVCLSNEVKTLKSELAKALDSALAKTDAKTELKDSQTKWLAYKESQCGDFIVAATQGTPYAVEFDLYCQSMLYKQRIHLLQRLLN